LLMTFICFLPGICLNGEDRVQSAAGQKNRQTADAKRIAFDSLRVGENFYRNGRQQTRSSQKASRKMDLRRRSRSGQPSIVRFARPLSWKTPLAMRMNFVRELMPYTEYPISKF